MAYGCWLCPACIAIKYWKLICTTWEHKNLHCFYAFVLIYLLCCCFVCVCVCGCVRVCVSLGDFKLWGFRWKSLFRQPSTLAGWIAFLEPLFVISRGRAAYVSHKVMLFNWWLASDQSTASQRRIFQYERSYLINKCYQQITRQYQWFLNRLLIKFSH